MKDADNSEPASCVCSVAPGTPHSQSTHHPITASSPRQGSHRGAAETTTIYTN